MWALGLIMHEMLSKTLPFDDVVAYISKPPKPLPDYVPKEIKKMITGLLDKD